MTYRIRRREFIAGIGAGLIASPAIVRAQGQPVVIRAGALKLIHSIAPYFYDQFVPAGYKIEVLPFETPTECKNAVVTSRSISARSASPRHCSAPPPVSRWW
jgi:NitT/TauT family transport system substrate-binding protein